MPHRHWVWNYSPLCIPIRLADNSIVYLSGVAPPCHWHPPSGIITVVLITLQISPRCRRMLWWLGWHLHCLTSQTLFVSFCLAGKMHSNPFPSSLSRPTKPLELVHSDLHGPLPVATREGYRYWITFLDDATSYQAAMRLKRKSQALEAFKLFKTTAENQLDAKIKELQDDKEGEYMSNEFIQFTDSCGIHRSHMTHNRP